MPNHNNNDKLAEYKKTLPKAQYNAIMGAFEKLWGVKEKEDQVKGA